MLSACLKSAQQIAIQLEHFKRPNSRGGRSTSRKQHGNTIPTMFAGLGIHWDHHYSFMAEKSFKHRQAIYWFHPRNISLAYIYIYVSYYTSNGVFAKLPNHTHIYIYISLSLIIYHSYRYIYIPPSIPNILLT